MNPNQFGAKSPRKKVTQRQRDVRSIRAIEEKTVFPFSKMGRSMEPIFNGGSVFRFASGVFTVLHESVEAFKMSLFRDASKCANQAKRVIIEPKNTTLTS